MLLTCTRDVPIRILAGTSTNLTEVSRVFVFQSVKVNAGIVGQVRPRPFFLFSFPTHYSPIIIPFYTMQPKLFMTSKL
jgi:hypothetical protein